MTSLKREISNAETEISGRISVVDAGSDIDERYFEGALQSVQCAVLSGSLFILIASGFAVMDGSIGLSLLLSPLALAVLLVGSQGVKRRRSSYLVFFLVICCFGICYSAGRLTLWVTIAVMMALGKPSPFPDALPHGTQARVGILLALEGLLSICLLLFWIVSGYTTHRLIRIISDRHARSVERHRMSVIRDTLEATVVPIHPATVELGKN
eukprot:Protomagalhaensia_wolfi_Nauph_80__2857@NODE_2959_length_931_cov_577_910314_g2321_i0_p1_GENE_NODE_2959_length_931_cov_577_910314_g2321_i0NODE_2959_length_931_cov_577_910314_g2321_i0_p1_ORF_typecomplete_len211_score11_51DUF1616/PF07760_11/6_3DUF4131/PF13567_6/4_4e02_NODE_2959_length_931_cov_577_910314_g2321_i0196828